MRQDRTYDPRMQKPKRRKRSYLPVENRERTNKHLEKHPNQNPRNGSGTRQRGRRRVRKRRRLPVKDGPRSRPERKPIIVRNFHAALNNTTLWENDKDHIMIKVNIHGKHKEVSINAMIDSGATEDFIDKTICDKHQIPRILAERAREIYLADGNLSEMGPITHIAKVVINIGSHQEIATLQVANLQNHEIILGMPWLKGHNPKIDWENEKITFDSERCITWCLEKSATIYAVPEPKAREENSITRFSEIEIEDQRLQVKRLTSEARIPTKGSKKAAGHDLYAQEGTMILAKGQGINGTGIAIGLPPNTYWRIAPRSGLALKHSLEVNAGVIDADSTGEIKVILVNLGIKKYEIHKGDKIAQLIMERIASEEAILVENLETTERGKKGFGSSDMELIKQVRTGADLLIKSPTQEKSSLRETNQGAPHWTPRPRTTSLQVRTSVDLLTNQSQKVTGRSGKEGSHNQHPKMAEDPLSEPSQEASQRTPRTKTIPLQAGTGLDLLTMQSWGVIGPQGQHKKNNKPQGKMYISEITQKEFRKAYRNGETTGL